MPCVTVLVPVYRTDPGECILKNLVGEVDVAFRRMILE